MINEVVTKSDNQLLADDASIDVFWIFFVLVDEWMINTFCFTFQRIAIYGYYYVFSFQFLSILYRHLSIISYLRACVPRGSWPNVHII